MGGTRDLHISGEQLSLTKKTGKGAFIIRTIFNELADNNGKAALRTCQQTAVDEAKAHGDTVSLEYVKNLIREVQMLGYWEKSHQGRKWFLSLTDQGEQFIDQLIDGGSRWGEDIRFDEPLTEQELSERAKMYREFETRPHRFRKMDPNSKEKFQFFWTLYKTGKLDVLAIPNNAKVKRTADPAKFIITIPEENL